MRPVVYVETSVLSYLAARPSRDVVVAAHQRVTAEWWQDAPAQFTLVASAAVTREAAAGDSQVAAARLAYLQGLPLLPVTAEAAGVEPPTLCTPEELLPPPDGAGGSDG